MLLGSQSLANILAKKWNEAQTEDKNKHLADYQIRMASSEGWPLSKFINREKTKGRLLTENLFIRSNGACGDWKISE